MLLTINWVAMKKFYSLSLYLCKYRLERLFQSIVRISWPRAIYKTLYRHIKFVPKNHKRAMIEDPDLKFMKEYFSETNNKVPLSPLCGLKLVNKIITDSLDEEYRLLLGLYLSNHNYREIAKEMNIPVVSVRQKIEFIRKTLSDKLSEY